jgi:hypothetical protein
VTTWPRRWSSTASTSRGRWPRGRGLTACSVDEQRSQNADTHPSMQSQDGCMSRPNCRDVAQPQRISWRCPSVPRKATRQVADPGSTQPVTRSAAARRGEGAESEIGPGSVSRSQPARRGRGRDRRHRHTRCAWCRLRGRTSRPGQPQQGGAPAAPTTSPGARRCGAGPADLVEVPVRGAVDDLVGVQVGQVIAERVTRGERRSAIARQVVVPRGAIRPVERVDVPVDAPIEDDVLGSRRHRVSLRISRGEGFVAIPGDVGHGGRPRPPGHHNSSMCPSAVR